MKNLYSISVLLLLCTTLYSQTTVTRFVSSSLNDSFQLSNGTNIIDDFEQPGNNISYRGYRFLTLGIPAGAIITNARLRVEAFDEEPTKTIQIQQAHFTTSMIAELKLERLKIRNQKKHYVTKSQIWLEATKTTWKQLDKLSTPHINFSKSVA